MRKLKIINVVGARPNFMKIAPLMREWKKYQNINPILAHTGQHYDEKMSKLFFEDLAIPEPDVYLEVGSGTHAQQTAEIMKRFEPLLETERPDLVLVVGDVNSTIACALTAAKMGIKTAHVEAGLRSFDRSMPEEINRLLTDAIADYLFITEPSAEENLIIEGVKKEKIFFVGNVMIDTLLMNKEKAAQSSILKQLGLGEKQYAVLTMHRPSNVDCIENLEYIMNTLREVKELITVVYPVHPRTRKRMNEFNLKAKFPFLADAGEPNNGRAFMMIDPVGYLDFLKLMMSAQFVITDSGGIQEETTILKIPCITIRRNTERPVTVESGSNVVTGLDKQKILTACRKTAAITDTPWKMPELWDGKASQRIVSILMEKLNSE